MAAATGLPVLQAIYTGSISIPHNDAWSHAKIAEEFGRTGTFQLVGWNRTALVGQVVPLGPFATSIVAQHLLVAALSLVALGATYAYLLRRVAPSVALLGTVLVGVTPEFGLLATSYMSDVPAFAALMLCLVLTDRAQQAQNPLYLALAVLVGIWGVTIREQGIVGPVVAVAVTSLAWRGSKRLVALGIGVLAAGAVGGFELWRRSLPYGDSPAFTPHLDGFGRALILGAFTIALYVAPAVFSVARPTEWTVRTRWVSVLALVSALAVALWRYPGVFLGNYLALSGAYPEAGAGDRTQVIPSWLWMVLVIVAAVTLALLVGVVLDRGFRVDLTSGLLGALLVVGTLAQAALGQTIFARYLIPLVPIVCIVLLKDRAPRRPALVLSTLACLAVVSAGITANALSFDAARWRAAATLQHQGVPVTDINPGMEWVGYHTADPAVRGPERVGASPYMSMFPKSRECYVVSAAPLTGARLISIAHYRTYAVFGTSKLWIYQRPRCL